jgi:hypothetical protein
MVYQGEEMTELMHPDDEGFVKPYTEEDWKRCYWNMSSAYYTLRDETWHTPKWINRFFRWLRG